MWSCINKICDPGLKCQFLETEILHNVLLYCNIEKIALKVAQMKFLAMDITIQKLYFDIYTVGYLLYIFMEHDLH